VMAEQGDHAGAEAEFRDVLAAQQRMRGDHGRADLSAVLVISSPFIGIRDDGLLD
jgi:hypothetical protein